MPTPSISYGGSIGPTIKKYTMIEKAMITSQICQNFIRKKRSKFQVPGSSILFFRFVELGTWNLERFYVPESSRGRNLEVRFHSSWCLKTNCSSSVHELARGGGR